MKTVRLDFCDFWPGFRKDDNPIYNLLGTRYAVELHEQPDFVIFSSFGRDHRLHSCTRIFFTGESHRPDFATCDYAFTPHYLDDPRHLRWPLYAFYYRPEMLLRDDDDLDTIMAAKTRFCCFIASNRKARKRNAFFRRLSRYKQVDAGGRVFNNLGYVVPGGPRGKIEFLKQYKFNIAFENTSIAGYTTEKIVEPMAARCLPIYWGNPLIHREFNPKSFLNYFDFDDETALIEAIIELDRDDALYRQRLAEPWFHHNTPNEFFQLDRVLNHFDMIFSRSIQPVAQRRRLFSFGRWTLTQRDRPMTVDQPTSGRAAPWDLDRRHLQVVTCPLCRGSSFETLATSDRYDMGLVTAGCRGCGLVMTNPRPTAQALTDFYRDHYRTYYQQVDRPSVEYIRKTRKDERAAATARFLLEQGVLPPSASVLDVGAAEGSILHALRQRQPDLRLTAVEPNPRFGEFARTHAGCDVVSDVALLAPERRFHVIILVHVLEHVAEPVEFLRALHQRLAPEGLLYIDVPDVEAYRGLEALHIAHLYHFSARTLREILAKAGWAPRLSQRHEPISHPPSIRVLAVSDAAVHARPVFSDEGWAGVIRIDRRAGSFHRRRWSMLQRMAHLGRWICRPSTWSYALRRGTETVL